MPTNFPKLKFLLSQLSKQTREQIKKLQWIDFGCGPASFGLGLIDEFGYEDHNFYRGIESSPFMRSQAKGLLKAYAPDLKISVSPSFPHDLDKGQFLCLGNVVNELELEEVKKIIQKTSPQVIMFLDIGTKEVFEKMLLIRKYLLNENYSIEYPCRTQQVCPMEGSDNWCHQKIFVTQDPTLERIGQKIKNDRRTLPFNAFVFSKKEAVESQQNQVRLIRSFSETKFGFSFEGCNSQGELHHYGVLKKNLSKDQIRAFKKIYWGELVTLKKSERKGEKLRAEIDFGQDND